MGRAPCCEKTGLKKGPWTPKEDDILVNYIQLHGHGNWRALPKLAGLLRCGKSCRLRWTNYLRPDIKRGNFSKEEEETIIQLHQSLGNRWSAIAARLPGRTDNEIKNVWHTRLKKKIVKTESPVREQEHNVTTSSMSSSENDSSSPEHVPEMDDQFWSQVLSSGEVSSTTDNGDDYWSEIQFSPVALAGTEPEDMDFWYDLFATASAGDLTDLTEI